MSTTHSMSTFTVSRDRQKPASSMVKPACMPKTRNAAISVQTVLMGLTMSLPLSTTSSACAGLPKNVHQQRNDAEQHGDAECLATQQEIAVAAPLRVSHPFAETCELPWASRGIRCDRRPCVFHCDLLAVRQLARHAGHPASRVPARFRDMRCFSVRGGKTATPMPLHLQVEKCANPRWSRPYIGATTWRPIAVTGCPSRRHVHLR